MMTPADDLAAEGDPLLAFKRAAVLAYYGVTPKAERRQHCPICGGFLCHPDGTGSWSCRRCGTEGDLGD